MSKSPRAIKSAFTKLNNQINQLAEKRKSIVNLKYRSERQIRRLKEHGISLTKMLGNADEQMSQLLVKHEPLKADYLESICK